MVNQYRSISKVPKLKDRHEIGLLRCDAIDNLKAADLAMKLAQNSTNFALRLIALQLRWDGSEDASEHLATMQQEVDQLASPRGTRSRFNSFVL